MDNQNLVTVEEQKKNMWDEALENESWVAPLVDIFESENDYTLIANMPGVSKENVKIKLEDGNLVIMGKINFDETLNRKFVLNETEIGNYYRKFRISENIDDSKIEAKLENGQLILELPKHERLKPKNIQIQ